MQTGQQWNGPKHETRGKQLERTLPFRSLIADEQSAIPEGQLASAYPVPQPARGEKRDAAVDFYESEFWSWSSSSFPHFHHRRQVLGRLPQPGALALVFILYCLPLDRLHITAPLGSFTFHQHPRNRGPEFIHSRTHSAISSLGTVISCCDSTA